MNKATEEAYKVLMKDTVLDSLLAIKNNGGEYLDLTNLIFILIRQKEISPEVTKVLTWSKVELVEMLTSSYDQGRLDYCDSLIEALTALHKTGQDLSLEDVIGILTTQKEILLAEMKNEQGTPPRTLQ